MAYEPVWAIGTGLSPTTPDITEIHKAVREKLHALLPASAGKHWRVLYGGLVTAANAAEIFTSPEVDGVLVGGASLKADLFLKIIDAARNSTTQRGA